MLDYRTLSKSDYIKYMVASGYSLLQVEIMADMLYRG